MFPEKRKRKAPSPPTSLPLPPTPPPLPPTPPPPNITEYKSKSSFNRGQSHPEVQSNSPQWSPLSSLRKSSRTNRAVRGTMSGCDSNRNADSLAPGRIRMKAELQNETSRNSSLPMPTVPPPCSSQVYCFPVASYGVALSDYKADWPGDLGFQENEIIYLLERLSNDWLYGRTALGREGMFPQDFIRIEVPIPGDTYNAKAIYEFKSETPGDLPLLPGQMVKVLLHISQDWLYGSSNGKSGRFPKIFVC